MEVSLVNSAGRSFCWNYVTDTFYDNHADDNVVAIMQVLRFCCNFAGGTFCYSYVESLCCNYAGDCFYYSYAVRSFSSTLQETVPAANKWVTIFIVIVQVGLSITIMQMVLSAVHS